MSLIILIAVLAFAVLVLALGVLYRQVVPRTHGLPVTAEWLNELSPERYRPMLRLLDNDDVRFLRAQPGFTRQIESKLLTQRCQLFRNYLRLLSTDFNRTCLAVKLLMLSAREDRPDLAGVLVRSQIQFACGILVVQCRLVLYQWGVGTAEAGDLVKLFDALRLELRTLVPAALTGVS
jgi:hypothetical protein